MKTRVAAAVTALVLGVAAPASSALAFSESWNPRYDVTTTGSLNPSDHPRYDRCPMSSASEGNAQQQNFPTKQYGQTSGGYRC